MSEAVSMENTEDHPNTKDSNAIANNSALPNQQILLGKSIGSDLVLGKNSTEAHKETTPALSSSEVINDVRSLPGPSTSIKEATQTLSPLLQESDNRHILEVGDIRPVWYIRDIDQEKEGDGLYVSDYAKDIMDDLFRNESVMIVNPEYMKEVQPEITPDMRAIVIDWLVDVFEELRITTDTLFITVGLMDRFFSLEPVGRKYLQLVGLTCFFIASKVDETRDVPARDLVEMSDNAYNEAQLFRMEVEVLKRLNFDTHIPISLYFLRRFILVYEFDQTMEQTSLFICELSLLEYRLVAVRPSCIAASCVALTALLHSLPEIWNPTMVHYTGYHLADLKDCIHILCDIVSLSTISRLIAIRRKFLQRNAQFVIEQPTVEHLTQLDYLLD